MDKVLVTGGNGLLGRHVVRELAKAWKVTVADRSEGPFDQPFGPVDALDLAALARAMQGQHAVVHLAAVDAAVDAPDQAYFHTNVLAAWNVLHTGYLAGVRRFVLCSSSSAYGIRPSSFRGEPLRVPLDESHPTLASDPYGLSKIACEATARGFARREGVAVTVLRPCFVAFPSALPAMREVKAGVQRDPAPGEWVPPLPPLRWFVAPEDAARCFRLALEHAHREGPGYDVFNVSAADTFSPSPTRERLREVFGDIRYEVDAHWFEQRPYASAMSCERARERLGWHPRIDWARMAAG